MRLAITQHKGRYGEYSGIAALFVRIVPRTGGAWFHMKRHGSAASPLPQSDEYYANCPSLSLPDACGFAGPCDSRGPLIRLSDGLARVLEAPHPKAR